MNFSSKAARLGGLLFPAWVCAATVPDAVLQQNDQQLRHQQQQLEQRRQELQQRPDVLSPLPAASPQTIVPASDAQRCFTLTRVELEGAPAGWLAWLQPLADAGLAGCVDLARINGLTAALTNEMVARGFVTSRVYLPEQNLRGGQLRLAVVPGRIHAIRLKAGASDIGLRSAFPAVAGDILNVRDLEQGLEQLGRVPGQQATMELTPADAPGESDVVVDRGGGRLLSGLLSLDDSGQNATGRLQTSGSLTLGGATGLNDALSLSWSQDAEHLAHPLSQSASLSWLLPLGNWTGFVSYSGFAYHQTVQGVNQSFTSSGHSRNTLLSLSRLLRRNQSGKTELKLSLTRKASRSFVEDAEVVQQRRDLTIAGLELSHRQYLGEAVLDGSISYQRGIGAWGAQPDTLAALGGPTARHQLYQGRLALQLPLHIASQTLRWSSELRGQYSPDLLMSSEQFAIGGRGSVRGFNTSTLVGQSGYYLRNELSWPLPPAGPLALEPYLGLDAGQVARPAYDVGPVRSLSGWAAGLRLNLGGHLSAELSHERALHQPQGWDRPAITHFSISAQW
ncbi:ShlB/FhaC/HecB family hemolysin secretion/activation protein [Chromobacterium violaceum]|uniref:ShlB/FhaC/HecB family hemolysin secretion/activation protein n=1 Tax=Chromobacterium violaceum TaxID=536 RepID=UPI00143D4ACE|nr:ShlB/FhaC/HecB family hemolysin secretion/activation protein [Chromobacterium violaceum]QIY80995.1 ShlB/FhaC/HecB family hemolysin secretion/activation protein [Chromobacterium violaceum]